MASYSGVGKPGVPARLIIWRSLVQIRPPLFQKWRRINMIDPDAEHCEGCPSWDALNGCWMEIESTTRCPYTDKNGFYNEERIEDCY